MHPHQTLIDRGRRFSLAIAGGGAQAVGELTRHGGLSGTLVEARHFQAREAIDAYLGGAPDRYSSEAAARALAMRAYLDLRGLVGDPRGSYFAIGAASSLVSRGEREGRKHRVHVAVQTHNYTRALAVELAPGRSREDEEALAARLIRSAVAYGAGVLDDDMGYWGWLGPGDVHSARFQHARDGWEDVVLGTRPVLRRSPHSPVLSTSANPLHEGHLAMMEYAHRTLGSPVDVEICVRNADKPALDYLEIADRLDRARDDLVGRPFAGEVFLSNVGRFVEKAVAMPSSTFLVGADTLERLEAPQFGGDHALHELNDAFDEHDCVFLAFPRPGHRLYAGPCTAVAADFTPCPQSSTAIREEAR